MIQILFAGGAVLTALFLAACNRQEGADSSAETAPSTDVGRPEAPALPDGGVGPAASGSSSPSATPPQDAFIPKKFTYEFNDSSLAGKYFQEIKRLGVAEDVLDQGCNQKKKLQGKQDQNVSACEVFNYALENYQKFPDLDKGLQNGALPWILDDNDPKTSFDEKIRKKVGATVQSLKTHPELKDLDPNSDEFKIKLATGLLYFADFPKSPPAIPWQWPQLREKTAELKEIGLGSFQEELFQKGGLGASELKEGPQTNLVATALEALEDPLTRGTDITKSNILFGVFERAGLLPKLYYIPMKYADPHKDQEFIKGNTQLLLAYHVVVGIPLSGGPRIFNLKNLDSRGEYLEIIDGNHGEYLGHNLRSKGYEILLNTGQIKPALRLLTLSLELTPNSPSSHNNVGIILEKGGKKEEAEKAYRESIRLDPKFPWGLVNMARLHQRRSEWAEAVSLYFQAVQTDPENVISEYKEGMLDAANEVIKGNHGSKDEAEKLIKLIEQNSPSKK